MGRCVVTAVESQSQAQSRQADHQANHAAGQTPGQSPLVLSLFPGADLLGRGFQRNGFVVVRGPDTLLDDPIEDWNCRAVGKFQGVIAGPPCQEYSDANRHKNPAEGDRLMLECLRCIWECQPEWFLIENVRNVPDVALDGYHVQRLDVTDCECGGFQKRLRHIQFGSKLGQIIRPVRTNGVRPVTRKVVVGQPRSPHDRPSRRAAAQGFPLRLRKLTKRARSQVIGNAVPMAIAESLARAVTARSEVTEQDCVCLCGRVTTARSRHALPSCRKRMERRRRRVTRTLTYSAPPAESRLPGHDQAKSWPLRSHGVVR